jgi:cytochrome c556
MKIPSFSFSLALFIFTSSVFAGGDDARQLVPMPSMMQQHMLRNMRDHLAALTEIQQALGSGAFERAADIAENRLGMSSLASHDAAHMAPHMPKEMQEIGTQMHREASQFARLAQEAAVDMNVKQAIAKLASLTQQCVACHAAYRIQ